jgi:hypothetical protein
MGLSLDLVQRPAGELIVPRLAGMVHPDARNDIFGLGRLTFNRHVRAAGSEPDHIADMQVGNRVGHSAEDARID